MRVIIVGGDPSGALVNALLQWGVEVVSEKEEDMGMISGVQSGMLRLAMAIASLAVSPPSVAFNLARQADYQVKTPFPTGQNERNHGPQRHAYGQCHPAVQTRHYRNYARRSSMNRNPDL